MRTYLYKLTSDRGGAPCALAPEPGADPVLTLAICKPAIRRTAQPGDRIFGVASLALERKENYTHGAVIWAGIVAEGIDARDYFAPASTFRARPDCIYAFHQENGRAAHTGRTPLHADPRHARKDLGLYPMYRNGRVLVCHDFRYFGSAAIPISPRLHLLRAAAMALGQGHRAWTERDPESLEAEALLHLLWRQPTRFSPAEVAADAYDHPKAAPARRARC